MFQHKVPAHLESFWSSKAYANKIQILWCLHHGYLSLIHVNKILVTPQPLSGILGKPAATEMNKRGFLKLLSISSVCRVKKLFPYHYFDGWATDKRQVICSLAYLDYSSFSLSRNKHGTKKYIWNRPVEEAKKTKCYKRLIYKQFVQISGLCGPQFLS